MEVIQASIKAGSVAQIVVAAIAVLGLIYLLKLVLITTLTSLLLAFILEPLVSQLRRSGLPRAAGALVAVVLMVALAGSLTFFFYNRAVDFAAALPKYSGKIRDTLSTFRSQSKKIEEGTYGVSDQSGEPIPRERLEAGNSASMAQIAADALEIPLERIRVLHGSTHYLREGFGSYGSRATVMGGSAIMLAAKNLLAAFADAAAGAARALAAALIDSFSEPQSSWLQLDTQTPEQKR